MTPSGRNYESEEGKKDIFLVSGVLCSCSLSEITES